MKFSRVTNAFYPDELLDVYSAANSLPDDLINVSDDEFSEFTSAPPEGKKRGVDDNGKLCWVNVVKTEEQISAENLEIAQAEYDLITLRITALNEQIQDADWDGTTENSVRGELKSITDYRKLLRAYLKNADGSQELPPATFK